MTRTKKPSPLVGEGVNRQVDERGKYEQKRKNENSVRRFALAKVAAEPSEGVSMSRNERITILTCVRKLTSIASQGSALPSVFGGS